MSSSLVIIPIAKYNMKKYQYPSVKIVQLDENDLICTSNEARISFASEESENYDTTLSTRGRSRGSDSDD